VPAARAAAVALTAFTALAVLTGCAAGAAGVASTATRASATTSPTTVSPELARTAVCAMNWGSVLDAAYAATQPSFDTEAPFAAAANRSLTLIDKGISQDEFRAMDRLVFATWRNRYQDIFVGVLRGYTTVAEGQATARKLLIDTRLNLGPACAKATIPIPTPPVKAPPVATPIDPGPTSQATALPEPGTAPENVYTCEQIVFYYAPFLIKDPKSTIPYLMTNSYGGNAYGGLEQSLIRAAADSRLRTQPKVVAKQACTA